MLNVSALVYVSGEGELFSSVICMALLLGIHLKVHISHIKLNATAADTSKAPMHNANAVSNPAASLIMLEYIAARFA